MASIDALGTAGALRNVPSTFTVWVPAAANVPATYAGVVIRASANLSAAQEFLTWLAGPDGQAVLAAFGFLPAP